MNLNRRPSQKIFIYIVAVFVVIGLFLIIKNFVFGGNNVVGVEGEKIQVQDAKSTKDINHELLIPIKDAKGNEVTKVKYIIQNAELRDEIVVKGKRGTAIQGRTFLIMNLKLVNDYKSAIDINTKDFVRVGVGENPSEWLAPEIHNDPVSVQAISTKPSRIGLPVDDGIRSFKLQIGEINGEKQVIDLNF